jgi:hypothetical protein
VALAANLPMAGAYLIIQRTFYAFEDGKHPFLFIALQSGLQLVVLLRRRAAAFAGALGDAAGRIDFQSPTCWPSRFWPACCASASAALMDGRRITAHLRQGAHRRLLVAVAGRLADEPSRSTRWSGRI